MKRFTAILLILLLAVVVPASAGSQRAQIGADVSGFQSVDIYGQPISGEVFHENYSSVVTYFATWNAACIGQLDILQSIHDSEPGFGVYALLYEDATSTAETAAAVAQEHGITFPIFVVDSVWAPITAESSFIPQSFIINKDGVIVEAWQAAFDSPDTLLERLIHWAEGYVPPDPSDPPVDPTDPPVEPTQPPVTPFDGDVDLNGEVNAQDALIVLRCSLDLMELTHEIWEHGDVNRNGIIDSADALIILRIALNMR